MADHHSSHDSHGEYHKGEMDIHEHKASFDLFVNFTKWGSLVVTATLTFFIILFCVKGADIFISGFVAVVIAVVGWLLLKTKAGTSH